MPDTPIATGEMLTSVAEHAEFIKLRGADFLMPDAKALLLIVPMLRVGLPPGTITKPWTAKEAEVVKDKKARSMAGFVNDFSYGARPKLLRNSSSSFRHESTITLFPAAGPE
jgi:hypothetical protein